MWVALVLRDMEKCVAKGGYSKGDIDERVHRLPKELGGEYGFYQQMLLSLSANGEDDMGQEERARRIFYWVTFPKRPISIAELEDVLATPLSQETDLSKYDFAYNRPHDLDLGIVSACGGLVEVSAVILSLWTIELNNVFAGARLKFNQNRSTDSSNCSRVSTTRSC